MKKVLSFVLVLAMILGSVATAFATINDAVVTKDNTVVPFPDAPNSGVATVLRDLGALKGNEAGLVNLKGELTRAEAATIVVRALGLEDLGKVPTATKFTDVPADAWYSGYVAQAYAVGAMKGQSDKTFAPLANITLDECVALVAQTLGYDAAHLAGSWPANYRNVARQVGFLKTVAVGTANATREDLCNLIYNALPCSKVEWVDKLEGGYVGANANNVQYTFAGETLFEAITGVGNKSIEAVYTSAATGVVTAETKFANGFDASAFYGKKVYFLQKANKAGKFENIGVWKLDTTTLTGKFVPVREDKNVFDKFVVGDKEYTFSRSTNTDLKTISKSAFTGNNYVYENGTTIAATNIVLDKDLTYEIDVTFADTAKTKIYAIESISYWRASEAAVVNATQAALLAEGNIVKLNASNKLGTYGFATTKASVTSTKRVYLAGSCVVEGAVTALEDIKEDDVVELFFGKVEDAKAIVKVVVTRNKVVGVISVVDGTTYTVNGKAYKKASLTAGNTDVGTPKATSEYALWLDSNGKYVQAMLATEKVTPDYLYAFITGYKPVKADEGEKVKEDVTYASIWLTIPGEDEVLYSSIKCLTGDAVHTNATNYTPGAFVKYTLKDGKLSSITKAAFGSKAGTTNTTVSATGFVEGKKLTADTKVYKVVSTVGVELAKDSNYVELSLDNIKGRSFAKGNFDYVVDADTNTVKFVIIKGNGTATGDVAYITGAAFLKATSYNTTTKKYDAKFITVDGEKTFAVDAKPTMKVTEVAVLTLTLGEYTTFATVTDMARCLVDDDRATLEAVTLVDGVLTVEDDKYFVADDVKVWFYDDTASAKGFVEKDFDVAQADLLAKSLYGFDFDGDGAYDLLVISAYKDGGTDPLVNWPHGL